MSVDHDDHYAVLQVQPDAEPEVIDAAYRQLMRKYHPDMAGGDGARAATLHEHAKRINRAYAILRDPSQRWSYDRSRAAAPPPRRPASAAWRPPQSQPTPNARGSSASARPTQGSSASARSTSSESDSPASAWSTPNARGASASGRATSGAPDSYAPADETPDLRSPARPLTWAEWLSRAAKPGPWIGLLRSISSLYYFLPGPYEWERGRNKDLLATWMLPPLGVAGWSLSSGRLNLLTGSSPYVGLAAWALLAVLALPLWPSLPRLILAGAPTALLLTGQVEGLLRLAGVPLLLAWIVAGVFGAVVSPRQYVFAVLPTLLLCWILSNANVGLAALGAVLARGNGWLSSGTLGLLVIASLVGLLAWLTVLAWRGQPAAPGRPMFRRLSKNRVQAMSTIPLRTDRDLREPVSAVIRAQQEANVVLVRDPWAFVQTDDGREGWAEWILSP